MQPNKFKRPAAFAALAGTATAAAAGFVMLNPGIAFPQPHLLSAKPIMAAEIAGSYTIDPMHTSIGFDIEHMGISHVQGRFDTKSGHIVADSKDLSKSGVSFTAQVATIDTAVAPRDADLKSANYFDADKYPEIAFQSTSIRKDGKHYVAEGPLTIKGISHNVSISFQYYGPIQDPFGSTRIGIVAEPITIHRLDYGVGKDDKLPNGSPALGNDVTVRLSVEGTLDKATDAPPPPPPP